MYTYDSFELLFCGKSFSINEGACESCYFHAVQIKNKPHMLRTKTQSILSSNPLNFYKK